MKIRVASLSFPLGAVVFTALLVAAGYLGYLASQAKAALTNEELLANASTMTSAEIKAELAEELAGFQAELEAISEAYAEADTDAERDEVEADLADLVQELSVRLAIYNAAFALDP